jgi:hypothetical protein
VKLPVSGLRFPGIVAYTGSCQEAVFINKVASNSGMLQKAIYRPCRPGYTGLFWSVEQNCTLLIGDKGQHIVIVTAKEKTGRPVTGAAG